MLGNNKDEVKGLIYTLYAIEDVCTGFGNPVPIPKKELAVREFRNKCKNSMNPEDLRLWKVGRYNVETGAIISLQPDLIEKGDRHELSNT